MAFYDRKTGEEIRPFGYELDDQGRPVREKLGRIKVNDYGCNPLLDGTFEMVPSGDIVSREEKERRLGRG